MVYGLFKRILQTIFEGREFTVPWKIQIIHDNPDKIEPYTSFFTLIEVIEELRKWSRKKKIKLGKVQIQTLLDFFKDNFRIEVLRLVRITDKTLDYVLDGVEWKDAIQLEITRNNNFTLVTDDDDLRNRGRKHYSDILDFKGLIDEIEKRELTS